MASLRKEGIVMANKQPKDYVEEENQVIPMEDDYEGYSDLWEAEEEYIRILREQGFIKVED
jgi:hypothetical protein